jgi:predicted DsbA family dithiol-disulfide isomerase
VSAVHVVEFTDPGCSWAWGTEPKLRRLRHRFGHVMEWRRVMGGLIGDMNNYIEDFDAVRAARSQSRYWRDVYAHTCMSYPVRLEWMYRSTEPACRAVKASELQSEKVALRVLRRLRESIFVFGRPPDTTERILESVQGVEGLDAERFVDDLSSEVVEKAFREDWAETRRPNEYVMRLEGDRPGIGRAKRTEGHWRFVFPTLIFRGPEGEVTVAGWCPYEDYEDALGRVAPGATADPRPDPAPEEFFAVHPTATESELAFVCGTAVPPAGVVTFDWGEGSFFLTAPEARARGIA